MRFCWTRIHWSRIISENSSVIEDGPSKLWCCNTGKLWMTYSNGTILTLHDNFVMEIVPLSYDIIVLQEMKVSFLCKKSSLVLLYKNWRFRFLCKYEGLVICVKKWGVQCLEKRLLYDTGNYLFLINTRNSVRFHVGLLHMSLVMHWSQSTAVS